MSCIRLVVMCFLTPRISNAWREPMGNCDTNVRWRFSERSIHKQQRNKPYRQRQAEQQTQPTTITKMSATKRHQSQSHIPDVNKMSKVRSPCPLCVCGSTVNCQWDTKEGEGQGLLFGADRGACMSCCGWLFSLSQVSRSIKHQESRDQSIHAVGFSS